MTRTRGRWRTWLKRLTLIAAGVIVLAFAALLIAYARSTNACDDPPGSPPAHAMKAITYCDYGTADRLRLEDVEKPVPGDRELLVKVRAAAVNPLDWHFVRGTPYAMRLGAGLRKPKNTRLGVDFSGTVEAVGPGVTKFKPGDEIFGVRNGAFADYLCIREDRAIALKPAEITFEQAASVPVAAVTALQALRDKGKVHPGTKVLINGASGGVGTFAVQIAKTMGAEVTGICSGRNVEMVRSLGADHVIDYTKDDFTERPERYDVLLDNVVNRPLSACRHVLEPDGVYVMIGGGGPNDGNWIGPFGRVFHIMLASRFVSQSMGMLLANVTPDDLTFLAGLMKEGKVTPVIDRRYPLSEVPDAIRYVEEGHARGKVVITTE